MKKKVIEAARKVIEYLKGIFDDELRSIETFYRHYA